MLALPVLAALAMSPCAPAGEPAPATAVLHAVGRVSIRNGVVDPATPLVEDRGVTAVRTQALPVAIARVELRIPAALRMTRSERAELTLQADANVLALLRTRVDGDTLTITADASFRSSMRPQVELALPTPPAVAAPRAAEVCVSGFGARSAR